MGKKKGPPYTDIPDCNTKDYDRLGWWMRYMLRGQRKGINSEDDILVDNVYARNTPSSDLPSPSESKEHAIKDPYPLRPHFVDIANLSWLKGIALPLPKGWTRIPTPPPTPPPPPPPPTPPPPATLSGFTPYEPPAHHPSHSTLYPAIKKEVPAPEPLSLDKFDPYDQEEAALRVLKTPSASDTSVPVIKSEPVYQPSPALLDTIASLPDSRLGSRNRETPIKSEPAPSKYSYWNSPATSLKQWHRYKPASSFPAVKTEQTSDTYEPSASLKDSIAALHSNQNVRRLTESYYPDATPVMVKAESGQESESERATSDLLKEHIQDLKAARPRQPAVPSPALPIKQKLPYDVSRDPRRQPQGPASATARKRPATEHGNIGSECTLLTVLDPTELSASQVPAKRVKEEQ
ncbi:hypothetical protein HWV62_45398 [Athelia sp. TMB]|nr:hypothetical protein HWV62_45398 [Athelia sp. TMB]